ncbi:MAG: oligosaccharide flippase family protein, partial [Rectinemataceae bacterium]|nr:oligosaccharide flippase family protein [Rectinemataceae bacterium]
MGGSTIGVIWIGISQFLLMVSNFLLLKLLTSQLSIYEFGQYSLCMSIALFARQVIYDPFSIVLAKECASSGSELQGVSDRFRVLRSITDRIGTVLFLFAFFVLVYFKIINGNHINGLIIGFCAVYLCANGAQGVYFNILNSIRERKPASLFSITDSVLKIILVFLAFWIGNRTLVYPIASISIGAFIVFWSLRTFVAKRYISSESFDVKSNSLLRQILMMSAPFVFSTTLVAVKSVGDRWMLAGFLGVNNLAEYSVLLQLGYAPIIVILGIGQTFIAPKIYSLCVVTDKNGMVELEKLLYKILLVILVITCLACGGSMVLAGWVFRVLVGKNYHSLTIYLPLFVISGALSAAASIFQIAVIGVFKSREASMFVVVSLVISVACTCLLIHSSGFEGAI